jgi:hypothetical protein
MFSFPTLFLLLLAQNQKFEELKLERMHEDNLFCNKTVGVSDTKRE